MSVRQTVLTGRPEITFSGRGYKAAGMGFYFQFQQLLKKIIINDPLTLGELMTRWKGIQLNGIELDRDGIIELVNQGEIIAYRRLPDIIIGGEITGIICVRQPTISTIVAFL